MKSIFSYSFLILALLLACNNDDETPVDPDIPTEVVITATDVTTTIDEGALVGDTVITLAATASLGDVSYVINEQNPAGAINVDMNSGVVTVVDTSVFIFANNQSIVALITASVGDVSKDFQLTININENTVEDTKTIWTGENITFSKAAGGSPNEVTNQDRITNNVWITRGDDGQLFNIKVEEQDDKTNSPLGTKWAIGSIDDIDNLTFTTMRAAGGGGQRSIQNLVNKDCVVFLEEDNIYISLKITSWDSGKKGGFTYERSTAN